MKFFKIALAVILILCLLAGCSGEKKETDSLADSYLAIAQNHIDHGDTAAAIAVLEEGYEATDHPGLAYLLEQLLSEQPTTQPSTTEHPTTEAPVTTEATTETTTEATTEAATESMTEETARPTRIDLADNFKPWDWYRINIFLSNFSEQHFYSLDHDDAYSLVMFAYVHNRINNPDALEFVSDGDYFRMSTELTDQTLYRFFGHTVAHDSHSKTYSGGYTDTIDYGVYGYYFPAASGEFYGYITIVDSMYLRDDGNYDVHFSVYEMDFQAYHDHGMSFDYYYFSREEAPFCSDLTYDYSGHAVVRDYDGGSYQSYQLIAYDIYR